MAAVFRPFRRSPSGRPGEWYYCLKHRTVEEGPECPAKDRLGPYATREEAAQAIDTARHRDAAWRNDPRWNDPEAGPEANPEAGPGREGGAAS